MVNAATNDTSNLRLYGGMVTPVALMSAGNGPSTSESLGLVVSSSTTQSLPSW